MCPTATDDDEDDSPFAAAEETEGSSNSRQAGHSKKSFAQVTAPKSGLAKIVTHTVRQTLDQNQRDDKDKRTVIATNVPQTKDVDDLNCAVALCSAISPHVVVEGVFRDCIFVQPKPAQGGSDKAEKVPILHIFLRSSEQKTLLLQNKGNLKSAPAEWMQTVYLRPSVSYEERLRRDQLYQISVGRNGQNPTKENRHIVWLNPRTEQYELRLIKDGQWAKLDQIKEPSRIEMEAAVKAVDECCAAFRKPVVPMDTGQLSQQSKND